MRCLHGHGVCTHSLKWFSLTCPQSAHRQSHWEVIKQHFGSEEQFWVLTNIVKCNCRWTQPVPRQNQALKGYIKIFKAALMSKVLAMQLPESLSYEISIFHLTRSFLLCKMWIKLKHLNTIKGVKAFPLSLVLGFCFISNFIGFFFPSFLMYKVFIIQTISYFCCWLLFFY